VNALKQAAKDVDDYNDVSTASNESLSFVMLMREGMYHSQKSAAAQESDVVDVLEVLRSMVGEGDAIPSSSVVDGKGVAALSSSVSSAAGERSMSRDYINGALRLHQKLIDGARRYAERQYAQYIKATIDDNRRVAQVKGRVGLRQDVRGFLNIMKAQWPRDVDVTNSFTIIPSSIITYELPMNICDIDDA
jgi:hypothetical protein